MYIYFSNIYFLKDECNYIVTVNDVEAPISVDCPAATTAATDAGVCSADLEFVVSGSDNCGGDVTVTCTPAQNSTYLEGNTVVSCDLEDDIGNNNSKEKNVFCYFFFKK